MAWEKKTSMKDAVKAFLVTEDGKVNLEASVDKFRTVALRTLAGQEAEDTLIVTCINQLFDLHPGANLNLDYIKSQTVERMKKVVPEFGSPALFSILTARVEDILHGLTDQPEIVAKGNKPAVAAITGRAFGMRKGHGGGFYRYCDQVTKA